MLALWGCVLNVFCKILDNIKSHIVKTTITILLQTIYRTPLVDLKQYSCSSNRSASNVSDEFGSNEMYQLMKCITWMPVIWIKAFAKCINVTNWNVWPNLNKPFLAATVNDYNYPYFLCQDKVGKMCYFQTLFYNFLSLRMVKVKNPQYFLVLSHHTWTFP